MTPAAAPLKTRALSGVGTRRCWSSRQWGVWASAPCSLGSIRLYLACWKRSSLGWVTPSTGCKRCKNQSRVGAALLPSIHVCPNATGETDGGWGWGTRCGFVGTGGPVASCRPLVPYYAALAARNAFVSRQNRAHAKWILTAVEQAKGVRDALLAASTSEVRSVRCRG